MTTRRAFLAGVGATAALAACGNSGGATGDPTGPVTLRFAWWGNDVRNKMTQTVIDNYTKANPNVTIRSEPGEWATYWDKLSTQYAGNDAPDIIQMDEQYIRDYSKRNALADLSKLKIDTTKFRPGLVETGTIESKVTALCAGVNALSILANPQIFQQAGVEIPNDKTWTWDQLRTTAAQITQKLPGHYGLSGSFFGDSVLRMYAFQIGKQLFTETGFGIENDDLAKFIDTMLQFQSQKAIPTPSETAEDNNKAMNQSMFGTGKTGMYLLWSNQINAMQAVFPNNTLRILRLPSMTGVEKDACLWLKSGQYQSINARSKNSAAAAKFLDYYFNSVDAGKVLLAERGAPANTDVAAAIQSSLGAADQAAAKYLDDLTPIAHAAPVAPPVGVSNFQSILTRHLQNAMFGRASAADAAKQCLDEAKGQLR